MANDLNFPLAILAIAFAGQWLAAYLGDVLRQRRRRTQAAEGGDFKTILSASLTLLGLIVGFTFSMAVSRYDLRKNYEEAEANAIGTEYARADILPAADAAHLRALLSAYLDQRISFYRVRDAAQLEQINLRTAQLQSDLWSAVLPPATAQATPIAALAVAGMNDVLNSQGYTQAAWWNRIPVSAWALMGLIAVGCNFLFGYSESRTSRTHLLILPLIVSLAFYLIADIDSPNGGLIRVVPQNLVALSQSLKTN